MTYLMIGTSVVWLGILVYMIMMAKRQSQMIKKLEGLEQRMDSLE